MTAQRFVLLLTLLNCLSIPFLVAQTTTRNGTWTLKNNTGTTTVLTIADNYLMQTIYEPNRFISTRGGTYQIAGNNLSLQLEFDTADSSRVGQTETYQITQQNGQLTLQRASEIQTFNSAEEKPTQLTGLWRITGRANDDGQITSMQRGSRKTIKLLTGSRFQWVAIIPQTKQFSGTGGGTYTLIDGKYTETIDFFSRDNSRVGRSLSFSAAINGNDWHHSGTSSTGGKVNEIWSREK